MNILKFMEHFPDERSCKEHFRQQREKAGIICNKCACDKHYWLKNRWQWHCSNCRVQNMFAQQYYEGIWQTTRTKIITDIRSNMKNQLMDLYDKIMLRKRSLIETINDQLKNICMIEHSRHRSFHNFLNNILIGIIAYSFLPTKPSIKFYHYHPDTSNNLLLF